MSGVCKHKSYFPITTKEIIGSILIIIGSALSNAGGIGGGGLLVPILILYLNFTTKEAIPISKLMILTGSLTAFIMGIHNKNPFRDATAIDYNIVIILVPLVLFGTMIGVTLNKIFPPWMILVCLTIILMINTYKTIKKGYEILEKERNNTAKYSIKLKEIKSSNLSEYSKLSTFDQFSSEDNSELIEEGFNIPIQEFNSITRKAQLNNEHIKDKVLIPFNKVKYCIISYILLLMITLLKGSSHSPSIINIQICSPSYWLIYLSYLPICLIITYIVGIIVYEEYTYRTEIGYPYHQSDVRWSKELIIKYPLYAFSAGILSGLLGIGGGLILGPLLLDLGIHPLVSTATSNFLVVFISGSTTIQYMLHGMMNYNYGFVCTILSTVGSCIGTFLIQKYLEKTKKNSVLVFILASVLAISTISIPGHTIIHMMKEINEGVDIWMFHPPC